MTFCRLAAAYGQGATAMGVAQISQSSESPPGPSGRRIVGWWFEDRDALDQENTRIWHTHYKPIPAHDHIANWQELLAEHRQIVVEVLEIAEEMWWRGPEIPARLEWKRRGGRVV